MIARLVLFAVVLSVPVAASPALDERYALRRTLAVVLEADRDAVYAEQVESELARLVRTSSRFEWSDEGYVAARKFLQNTPNGQLVESVDMSAWKPMMDELSHLGVQSVIAARLDPADGEYRLKVALLTVQPPEVIGRAATPIGPRPRLNSVIEGVRMAWNEVQRSIPFDGAVLKREGYRVVIDRGRSAFREGTRISAYTLEPIDGVDSGANGSASPGAGLHLVETGLIQLTRVDANLSFGRIVVEWKPREVATGNKIKLAAAPYQADKGPLFPLAEVPVVESSRAPASAPTVAMAAIAAPPETVIAGEPRLGSVTLDLTGSAFALNRTDASTGAIDVRNAFFPGAAIRGEAWLTRQWFTSVSYAFALGGWSGTSGAKVNGTYNQFRLQGGYRWNLIGSELGPSLRGRFGYSTTGFGTDPSSDPASPNAARFKGILVGGDFVFPFTTRFGLGLEANGLLFPSLSEPNGTSGAKTDGVSAWDFALRGYYQLDPDFRIESRFLFQSYDARFTGGAGTAPAALTAMSTAGKAFSVGMNYRF